jgi:prophage antirepressor-like protein
MNRLNGAESDAAGVNLPTVFKFKEHSVRTVDLNGEIWFVAADVCKALGLDNTTKALIPLDDDETALTRIQGIPGKGEVNLVSESGLYNVIFTSRKPESRLFKRWVTHDVLPEIRKTGQYGTPRQPQIGATERPAMFVPEPGIWTVIVANDRSFRIHPETIEHVCAEMSLFDLQTVSFSILGISALWEKMQLAHRTAGKTEDQSTAQLTNAIAYAVGAAQEFVFLPPKKNGYPARPVEFA